MSMHNIDEEWEKFISYSANHEEEDEYECDSEYDESIESAAYLSKDVPDMNHVPESSNIYISTKTKIAYLNTSVDLKNIFWNVDIIHYTMPKNGVVKKQIKFNSNSQEELEMIQSKLKDAFYFEEHVITHIDNPTGRIKFKDVRKVSIGISKKDIMRYRCKKKSAFYNCFVLILRLKVNDEFKEFHVKVFNTGKIEIPGIQSDDTFELILQEILHILKPHISPDLDYKANTNETVLINSNFNCGYFINREALYEILKYKYNIQAIYDPCSYPGIQCKFYYKQEDEPYSIQNGVQQKDKNVTEVSFMIFRTGSILIVGKCDENVLMVIYQFLKNILTCEYKNIFQKSHVPEVNLAKDKLKKMRRKTVLINVSV